MELCKINNKEVQKMFSFDKKRNIVLTYWQGEDKIIA